MSDKSLKSVFDNNKNLYPGWTFFKYAMEWDTQINNVDQQAEVDLLKAASSAEMKKIGKTVCSACSGRGHTSKGCKTTRKMTALGKCNNTARQMIAFGRKQAEVFYGHDIMRDHQPNQYSWFSGKPRVHKAWRKRHQNKRFHRGNGKLEDESD